MCPWIGEVTEATSACDVKDWNENVSNKMKWKASRTQSVSKLIYLTELETFRATAEQRLLCCLISVTAHIQHQNHSLHSHYVLITICFGVELNWAESCDRSIGYCVFLLISFNMFPNFRLSPSGAEHDSERVIMTTVVILAHSCTDGV